MYLNIRRKQIREILYIAQKKGGWGMGGGSKFFNNVLSFLPICGFELLSIFGFYI